MTTGWDADRRGDGFRDDRRGPPRDDGYRDDRRDPPPRDDDRRGRPPRARTATATTVATTATATAATTGRRRGARRKRRRSEDGRAASATTGGGDPLVRGDDPVTVLASRRRQRGAPIRRLGQEGRRRALRPRIRAEAGAGRRRPASTRRSSSSATLAADSADTLAASVDAKAIGDAFPSASRYHSFSRPPSIRHGQNEHFIPPVRYLLFRASAAFFRSASSRSRCEWRVAISRRLFGRLLREGGGFSVASAMASCSAATQASLVFPFGSVPSKSGTPAMPKGPVLVDALDALHVVQIDELVAVVDI